MPARWTHCARASATPDACGSATASTRASGRTWWWSAPSPEGRLAGARPTWLAGVLHPDTIDDVVAWVRDGGPGVEEPPGILDLSAFAPSRKQRAEAGET